MKAKDLIAELQRFNDDDNVAIELNRENVEDFKDNCDEEYSVLYDVDTVQPENSSRHSCKLTFV